MTFLATRFGQANRTGDANANFARVVKEEIMAQYEDACLFKDKHTVVDTTGSGAYFMRLDAQSTATIDTRLAAITNGGTATDFLPSSVSPSGNVPIYCDYTYQDVKTLTNYDLDRAPNKGQELDSAIERVGSSVARMWDVFVLLAVLRGATVAQSIGGFPMGATAEILVGNNNTGDNITTGSLETALPSLQAIFNRNNIPMMSGARMLALNPVVHAILGASSKYANSFLGGSGSVSTGNVSMVQGFEVMSTNQIPAAAITEENKISEVLGTAYGGAGSTGADPTFKQMGEDPKNTYTGDNSKVVGVAWHPKAVVTGMWRRPEGWSTLDDSSVGKATDGILVGARQRSGTAPFYHPACGRITWKAA